MRDKSNKAYRKQISNYRSKSLSIITLNVGNSLVVQWVRLCTPNAGSLGLIPGQGTISCMHAATKSPHATTKSSHAATKKPARHNLSPHVQLRSLHATMKIPRAATKTQCSQNK